ncbi:MULTISPECIES: hypothetical protein [unclassified Streptomyces]|uniref:hypothetical protein n=1 Tax=unclassified Streptomyces TaxID=2593676 RepID=UPI002741B446|nr:MULTISPECIES: hypothetical protein [unclassified Streptomyces]
MSGLTAGCQGLVLNTRDPWPKVPWGDSAIRNLSLSAPAEERRFGIAGSDPAGGTLRPADPERVAASYLEDLFRRGRVHVPEEHRSDVSLSDDNPSRLKTHEITRSSAGEGLALVRKCFD